MIKSEYVSLMERGNQHDDKLLNDFIFREDTMSKEIACRTSDDTFDNLEETIYKVYSTGASISTGCSVSLLYRYCAKLARDKYFTPSPEFHYIDDLDGAVCTVILPRNAPLRQVDSLPCPSKDEAKRNACLKACKELHERGALTDFLLPGLSEKTIGLAACHYECDINKDENLREDLHEMLVPAALTVPWSNFDDQINLYFYCIRFVPIPEDRQYRKFGLLLKAPLPKEAEALEVDLHLAHGRKVKTAFVPLGMSALCRDEILLAQNFQEMCLKVILDRSEFESDGVSLGKVDTTENSSTLFYLLLPVKQQRNEEAMFIDWATVRRCLSSPIFGHVINSSESNLHHVNDTLELRNGPVDKSDVVNSLVYTPHNKLFFFIDDVLHGLTANSPYVYKGKRNETYEKHFKTRFHIQLSHLEQPFLKAKQLFSLRNLLHDRSPDTTEVRETEEHFVELPPELCSLKIVGFSKDIGSSLSLLPSLMHRLENLLVAIELKDMLSASFPEAADIRADQILEAITTEKCLERFSLERFEVLGDAFLKYAVGRHTFLSCEGLDEGQLTCLRSSIVNNSHLYELAVNKNLQRYIRDELFDPNQFFPLGRPCKVVCDVDTESLNHQRANDTMLDGAEASNVKCTKSHHWLYRKTIADVVEALVGAFLVESGCKAAIAFLRWIGIKVDFKIADFHRVREVSKNNLSLINNMNITELEELLGYTFKYKGLLLEAFVHPSYTKHSGGCFQKLEFLGDAVLEYLTTSYLYSVYPDLKPGQITDLRSLTVNNNSFAHIAVWRSLHKYLIKDSNCLAEAVNKFECFVQLSDAERELLDEPACPKVLGDIVESCVGAVLLDTGFDLKRVWSFFLMLLEPALCFSSLQFNPIRKLRELCQCHDFGLAFPDPMKEKGGFFVKVEVDLKGKLLTFSAFNHNSKAARRVASQEALSKLKALGYKLKSKPLEDIVQSTRKKEPELIGFDEVPIITENVDCIPFEKLKILESKMPQPVLLTQNASDYSSSSCNKTSLLSKSQGKPHTKMSEVCNRNGNQHEAVIGHQVGTTSAEGHKMARSHLFETCAANYWNPPTFECCRAEGPSHFRMFTYKVTVRVGGVTPALLECFSEAKPQKKAAQEHAAEGALWYLKQLGYEHKP